MRVDGTTERPRLPKYLSAVVYLPTYLRTKPSRLSVDETASGGCCCCQHQQQQQAAAASNIGYLLHLLHLLLLVLSICLLPRATRPVPLFLPYASSPSLPPRADERARARARHDSSTSSSLKSPPPSTRATYHTATITARYTRYTPVLLRNRIAATPVALRATPIRARAHTYTGASTYMISTPCVHIRAKLRLSRSGHTHLRTHTLVHSYRAMHTCNTHACVHKSTTA